MTWHGMACDKTWHGATRHGGGSSCAWHGMAWFEALPLHVSQLLAQHMLLRSEFQRTRTKRTRFES